LIINAYDYNLQDSGTLEDYLYAIHQFAVAAQFWEVDSVTTSGGAPTFNNITLLIIRLKSNTAVKIRFTPVLSLFGRNTILIYFTDGSTANWGDIAGENWSPPSYIDGMIFNTTQGGARGFSSICQNGLGVKGATFVETDDMCSMFVYGRGTYASNWQFGFAAGKLVEWHLTAPAPWSIMAGSPCHLSAPSASNVVSTSAMPQTYTTNIPASSNNNVSKSCFTRAGNEWVGMASNFWQSSEYLTKVGDPSGTQYECLAPIMMCLSSVKAAANTGGTYGGFTKYVRMLEADQSLDYIYDSPFSPSISWRRQTFDDGGTADTKWGRVVWLWPQGIGTTGTALT
jgi:hypothetical protein